MTANYNTDFAQLSGLERVRHFKDHTEERFGMAKLLGYQVEQIASGKVELRYEPDKAHVNLLSTIHGGVLASLLDTVMGCALMTLLDAGEQHTTIDLRTKFVRPVMLDSRPLTTRGSVEHRGRRQCTMSGTIITPDDKLCASGSTALLQSIAHLKLGMADIALIVGAEKMFFPGKRDAMLAAFRGGTDIHQIDATEKKIRALGADVIPNDVEDKAERSFFMDVYAAFARQHMKTFGTSVRQLAMVAAKNHYHSTLNPLSQYQTDMSVDDVLDDKPICWPFTRSMCAPISDGAAAALVCTESSLTEFDRSRAIEIRGLSLASGTRREIGDYSNHIGRRAALQAYDQAGITGTDVDVAEVHDATSFAEIQQIENLGLCAQGEGGPFSESGATSLGGQVPVNPSGGLVSKGHPVGATGIAQIFELVTQLRGEAGKRQVAGACVAVTENGGGFYDVEDAATTATVLAH